MVEGSAHSQHFMTESSETEASLLAQQKDVATA